MFHKQFVCTNVIMSKLFLVLIRIKPSTAVVISHKQMPLLHRKGGNLLSFRVKLTYSPTLILSAKITFAPDISFCFKGHIPYSPEMLSTLALLRSDLFAREDYVTKKIELCPLQNLSNSNAIYFLASDFKRRMFYDCKISKCANFEFARTFNFT